MFAQITQFLVDTIVSFFVFMLLARFHFQWLRVPFRNQVGAFVVAVTDWVVKPARRVIPPLAGLDLATWMSAWMFQTLGVYFLLALRGWELGAAPGVSIAVLLGVAFIDLLRFSLYILLFAVIIQAVLSWVNPYTPVGPVFDALARPFLQPFRRIVPPIANVDLSPLLLIVALQVILIPVSYLRAAVGQML